MIDSLAWWNVALNFIIAFTITALIFFGWRLAIGDVQIPKKVKLWFKKHHKK